MSDDRDDERLTLRLPLGTAVAAAPGPLVIAIVAHASSAARAST